MVRKKLWWFTFIMMVLLIGCQSNRQENSLLPTSGIIPLVENIEAYLVKNIGLSASGGKIFCAYAPLDAIQGSENKIFLWVLCQEYYLEQEGLVLGSGISLPVALRIQVKNNHFEIVDHILPRDGAYYGPDVRDTFPQSTWSQILPQREDEIYQSNDRVDELETEIDMKARSYYGIETP